MLIVKDRERAKPSGGGKIMTELSLDPYDKKNLSQADMERLLHEEGRKLLGADFQPGDKKQSKQLKENQVRSCNIRF